MWWVSHVDKTHACMFMHLVSGRQNECVCVTEQDGLPERPESSLVSRAYCHDNILHITQQSHRAARLLLSPIELKVSLHINTHCLKSTFLLLDYTRLLTAYIKIAFCLDNYNVSQICINKTFSKATCIAFKAMYMGIPVAQTAEN